MFVVLLLEYGWDIGVDEKIDERVRYFLIEEMI